jgi:hypothetical protein
VDGAEMSDSEVEQNWVEFWRPLLLEQAPNDLLFIDTNNGAMEQIKKELHDYHFMMTNTAEVFMEVSGHRISKPNTLARCVLGEAEEVRQEDMRREIKDWIETVQDEIGQSFAVEDIIKNLKEAFGITPDHDDDTFTKE